MLWKSIRLPVSSSQTARRSPMGAIGVRDSHSSSMSILRRERLSTMATSYPCAERCSEVGQPQKPSPPRTSTFITRTPLLLYDTSILSFRVRPEPNVPADDCNGKIVERILNQCKRSAPLFLRSGKPGPPVHLRTWLRQPYRLAYPADAILTQINRNEHRWPGWVQ